MAVSAYRGGRLKKHALLGTSLAVDPARTKERTMFRELYGRARARAADPAAFRAEVGREFAASREKGLAALAETRGRMGALGGEISGLESAQASAVRDIQLGEERGAQLAKILGTRKYKKYKKQKRWQREQMRKAGMLEDIRAYAGEAGEPWRQPQNLKALVSQMGRSAMVTPAAASYLASITQRGQAAREALPGTLASLAERRAQFGEAQRAAEETYVPLARRAQVYSGFFGGV